MALGADVGFMWGGIYWEFIERYLANLHDNVLLAITLFPCRYNHWTSSNRVGRRPVCCSQKMENKKQLHLCTLYIQNSNYLRLHCGGEISQIKLSPQCDGFKNNCIMLLHLFPNTLFVQKFNELSHYCDCIIITSTKNKIGRASCRERV